MSSHRSASRRVKRSASRTNDKRMIERERILSIAETEHYVAATRAYSRLFAPIVGVHAIGADEMTRVANTTGFLI